MKQRGIYKAVMIAEIIFLYLSILNVISHARGPIPYTVDTENPLVQVEEFLPFFDMGVTGNAGELPILNTTPGVAAGYHAELALDTLGEFQVSFSIDCPAECAGSVLIVDLYNLEENYDTIEQEVQVALKAGENEVAVKMAPGEQHPNTAQLRIFTVQPLEGYLCDLYVGEVITLERVTATMLAVPAVLAVLLIATVVCHLSRQKKESIWKEKVR